MQSVRISVPATSANLGPGFDSLGLAVNMYANFTFTLQDEGLQIEGCPDEFKNEDNLAVTAFRGIYWRLGKRIPGLKLEINSDVPPTRGMGSSSAMLTGGVLAANHFLGNPFSKTELLEILTTFEGHPDNVTPALYGGFTATAVHNGKPHMASFPVSDEIKLCALIPSFQLSTSSARMALPNSVSHQDCVYNLSRVALLIKAFETADKELFSVALNDRLHQPYREHMIDDYKTVRLNAIAAGAAGIYLSGAGPTIMCVYFEPAFPDRIAKLLSGLRNQWIIKPLEIDRAGATVEEI
ncbi:MAG: homoserine kinase [Clostridia bacterium]|nr:homoserine kinase [Clostridia bacterium]MBQ4157449.1 homoserine kinase [Clostridia bacterium]